MNENPINFSRQFRPPGLAGQTSAPANVEQEPDVPPGAPPYESGPLANGPKPSPTPAPPSLSTLADGGTNHQTAWMSGQSAPQQLPEQKPFAAVEDDSPPGAAPYSSGPLAVGPKPSPTPRPQSIDPAAIKHFGWSSAFDQAPAY